MSGTRRSAAFGFSLSLVSLIALEAAAFPRIETLRWQDTQNASGMVTGYRVYYGTASRTYMTPVALPIPAVVDGAFQAAVVLTGVSDDADLYIAVTALNASSLESSFSNEICRGGLNGGCGSTTPPPEPTPTPTPTTASGAILGFSLWNAQTDVVIDSNFQSGEQISLATHSCVAIEIRTNSYLQASGAGSVKKVLDRQLINTSCNQAGVTHENSAPFAWETDEGPNKFACSPTLMVPGTHTLSVRAFDGDDCTGTAGNALTLQFEVIAAPTPPPSEPLGQPGQPFLIP